MIRRRIILAAALPAGLTPAAGLQAAAASAPTAASAPATAAPAATAADLVFGQSADLSGPLGPQVRWLNAGLQLKFDEFNAAGGLQGRRLRLVSHDDRGEPARAVAAWRSLARDRQVLAYFCCTGSATTAAAEPVLRDSGAPAIGGYAVADSVRQRCLGAAYFIRAGYALECEALVRHLLTVGINRIGVAYAAGPGGEEPLRLVERALAERKLEVTVAAGIEADGRDLPEAARKLMSLQPQAVVMFLTGTTAADLMRAMQAPGPRPRCYGLSIVAPELVTARLGPDAARGLTLAQTMPYPWHAAEPTTVAYRRAAQLAGVPVGYASFEGYVNACVLIEALQRCGGEFTRTRLHAVMRKMQWRCAGLDIDFGNGGHTGSRFVELVQLTAGGQLLR